MARLGNSRRLWRSLLAALMGLALVTTPASLTRAAQSQVYTVAKIAVNNEGSDAVTAKQTAITEASHRALHRLLLRLVAFSAHDRLPELSDEAVEGLLDGFSIREERFSSTRYIAELDITFDAEKVRDLLNRFSLPHTDVRSPPVKLLPIIEGAEQGDVWRRAWQAQDLANGLVPFDLTPEGVANLPAGLSATGRAVELLKDRIGAPRLVLAAASADAESGRLRVMLTGEDAVGPFAFSQSFRIYDGDVAEAAYRAARISHLTLEARWRRISLKSQGALEGPAPLAPVELTATFDSLKAWQEMRAAIAGISGVQDLEVKSLFAGGAEVVLSFPGGAERFAKAAGANGMILSENRGEWILRRR